MLERPSLRAAIDLARPRADEELLDVGTGTGALLRELAVRPDRPGRAVGVDSSPAMLAAARDVPAGWELAPADARELPVDDGRFDVVTCAYLLHLLPPRDRAGVLGEVARVLRPGGRLVTVTPATPRGRLGRRLLAPVAAVAERSSGAASGLRQLDPAPEVARHLTLRRTRFVNRGYPSLCVLASRPADGPRAGGPAPTG